MQLANEITFHELPHSDALEASIRRWITRLDACHDRITRCDVRVGIPHKHHRHGRELAVTVELSIPNADAIISHSKHENPYVAIADAFRAARRQLLERAELMRGYVKVPASSPQVLPLIWK